MQNDVMLKLNTDNRYLPGEMSFLVALGFDALELPLCNASLSSCRVLVLEH